MFTVTIPKRTVCGCIRAAGVMRRFRVALLCCLPLAAAVSKRPTQLSISRPMPSRRKLRQQASRRQQANR